jgi:protein SCO1/2
MRSNALLITSLFVTGTLANIASAQQFGLPASTTPLLLQGVGIDQNLNAQVPLELNFRDETGQSVRLGQYFRNKPVVLALVYYECPGLCDLILNGLQHTMQQVSLGVGSDYDVVTVSFNPKETWQLAQAKKANYIEKFQASSQSGAKNGWHFLTGDQPAIKSLADTVGFHYKWDATTNQFVHASAIMVLTPEGKISKYFYGIEYKPLDFRLGLVEASSNKIGTVADQVLLFCCQYDPTTGKYGMVITRVIRVLGTATALLLFGFVFIMFRRDRRSHHQPAGRSV